MFARAAPTGSRLLSTSAASSRALGSGCSERQTGPFGSRSSTTRQPNADTGGPTTAHQRRRHSRAGDRAHPQVQDRPHDRRSDLRRRDHDRRAHAQLQDHDPSTNSAPLRRRASACKRRTPLGQGLVNQEGDSALRHTDLPSQGPTGGCAGHPPATRVRTRRRRLRPALGWPGREPAPAPEALARMPAPATGAGREPELALESGREMGPATRVAVGGGPSAQLLHAAASAGGRRLPGDGASASAHGAGHPAPRHAEPSAPGQNAPTVHAGDAAPRRSNRSRCRPCPPGARGCDPSRASSVCMPCRLDRPRT